jgi:hypothetical protein
MGGCCSLGQHQQRQRLIFLPDQLDHLTPRAGPRNPLYIDAAGKWTPLKTSPIPAIHDSLCLCDLRGADDAWAAWLLGFGRALRATECRRRSSGEAERHYSLARVRKAIGEGVEALGWSEGRPSTLSGGPDVQDPVLQALYNLSDDQAEFVIQDRLSFMSHPAGDAGHSPRGRFLGLSLSEKVPDAKTIWLFRESLVRAGAPSTICSLVSTSTSHAPATWPGAVTLSMPPSSRRPGSTTARMRKQRSRQARSLKSGR